MIVEVCQHPIVESGDSYKIIFSILNLILILPIITFKCAPLMLLTICRYECNNSQRLNDVSYSMVTTIVVSVYARRRATKLVA